MSFIQNEDRNNTQVGDKYNTPKLYGMANANSIKCTVSHTTMSRLQLTLRTAPTATVRAQSR